MNQNSPSEHPYLLDQQLLEELLKTSLKSGGNFAEVYIQHRESTFLDMEDGEIRSAQSGIVYGVGIRVFHGEQVAYTYSDDLTPAVLLDCAKSASTIEEAKNHLAQQTKLNFEQKNSAYFKEKEQSPYSIEDYLYLLQETHSHALQEDSTLKKILGSYIDTQETIVIVNSEGLLLKDQRQLARLNLSVQIKDGEKTRVGSYGGGNRQGFKHYQQLKAADIAKEAVRMAKAQCQAVNAPTGEQTVVLGPASSGILLHEAVGHGLEADFIRKKSSLFTDQIGQKVASEHCTVIDDGTISDARGSLDYDDEGTPTQKNVLIEKGILKSYLSDKRNSAILGFESSGNARRQSFKHQPLPRMTNTYLEAGQESAENITKTVKNGIYCRAFGGGQVDIANGNFVFEVREGYLIENGEITKAIQGATLVGNGPEILKKISMVANDLSFDPGIYTCGKAGQSVPVTVGLPTVKLEGVTIGGTR